ncbi:hypothetical protein KJ359_011197 [Pestalotiopsis sp. 9143b]|nr:hypothetical protein KJ359_011197 [Pestalotiopsis sp. 9143b]
MPSQRHVTRRTVVSVTGRLFIYNEQAYLIPAPEENEVSGGEPLAVSFLISTLCTMFSSPHLRSTATAPGTFLVQTNLFVLDPYANVNLFQKLTVPSAFGGHDVAGELAEMGADHAPAQVPRPLEPSDEARSATSNALPLPRRGSAGTELLLPPVSEMMGDPAIGDSAGSFRLPPLRSIAQAAISAIDGSAAAAAPSVAQPAPAVAATAAIRPQALGNHYLIDVKDVLECRVSGYLDGGLIFANVMELGEHLVGCGTQPGKLFREQTSLLALCRG